MAAIYGPRWSSAYGERCDETDGKLTVAGDTWQRGLSGVGEKSIGVGLNACVLATDSWPPTLPAFRAMCFGIPSFASIKYELAHSKTERSAFGRQAWFFLDAYRFARSDVEHADRLLREAYDLTCEYVMQGMPLPAEPVALIEEEKQVHVPASPDTATEHLAKMAALFQQAEPASKDAAVAS